ncbi:glycosyltransferase [Ligilactobacillus equi]
MIFVTVGTHEQQFNRLLATVDNLKAQGVLKDEVVMQTGFSTYEPKHCQWQALFPYQEMQSLIQKARIVITHGGPSSFMQVLKAGKIPVVVPRLACYREHVNDHQLAFARAVQTRYQNLLLVEAMPELAPVLANYETQVADLSTLVVGNNQRFNQKFEKLVWRLMEGEVR